MHILVADRQSRIRSALRLLLEQQAGPLTIDEAEDGLTVLAEVHRKRPEILLLDWNLSGLTLEQLITEVKRTAPDIRIIVLATQPMVREIAMKAGADDFVSKNDPPERLIAAIAKAYPTGANRTPENITPHFD